MLGQAIETHIQAHRELVRDRSLLQTVRGIGQVMSTLLLPVLQPERFDKAPQAAVYMGVIPVEHQSGSSVNGRPRLSKAGDAILRAKLSVLFVTTLMSKRCMSVYWRKVNLKWPL